MMKIKKASQNQKSLKLKKKRKQKPLILEKKRRAKVFDDKPLVLNEELLLF